MVNQEGGTESSRVRKDREEENAGGVTPSKKRRQGGKNEAAEASPDASGKLSAKAGEDGNNGTVGGNGEKAPQGSAGGGGDRNEASADPTGAGAGAATGEGALRSEEGAQEVYRIPSYAAWFRWEKVHQVERRAMSEFFDRRSAAKSPRIYKEYRDFIINKYRENPKQALTFNEVRRMLIGDVNSLSRVFEFLEHWGLINQQVGGDMAMSEGPMPAVSVMDSYPSGMNVVRMPVVGGGGGRMAGIATFESSGRSGGGGHVNNLSTHMNVYSSGGKKAGSGGTAGLKRAEEEVQCSSCKKECSKQRYYRKQQAGSSFCLDCVKKGKLPAGTAAGDLVQVSGGEGLVTGKEWTSKETLLLLEAVSRFGENWNQVAAQVPTRSKVECVNHFIQLPFGDNYCVEPEEAKGGVVGLGATAKDGGAGGAGSEAGGLSGHTVSNGAVAGASRCDGGADGGGEGVGGADELVSPFTDTSHPLFSQVALLAGMVGPRVAAAAARAAVLAIAEDEPGVSELPFMQSSRTYSGGRKPGGAAMQSQAGRLTEGSNVGLQSNGEGSSQGEAGTTEDGGVGGKQADASKGGEEEELPSAAQARISVATALGVAGANAKLLADEEEREIEHLVASVIDNQMKKLYSKLEHFEELEMLLEKERQEVERARQQVYADRLRYAEAQTASAKSVFRSPAPS